MERICGILQPLIKSKIRLYSNLANTLTLLQQFYMLPFFSISKDIFKENPPKQWSKERVFGVEGYEEEFYSPSIQYSLPIQEYKHLIKFYGGAKNINYDYLEKVNKTLILIYLIIILTNNFYFRRLIIMV